MDVTNPQDTDAGKALIRKWWLSGRHAQQSNDLENWVDSYALSIVLSRVHQKLLIDAMVDMKIDASDVMMMVFPGHTACPMFVQYCVGTNNKCSAFEKSMSAMYSNGHGQIGRASQPSDAAAGLTLYYFRDPPMAGMSPKAYFAKLNAPETPTATLHVHETA